MVLIKLYSLNFVEATLLRSVNIVSNLITLVDYITHTCPCTRGENRTLALLDQEKVLGLARLRRLVLFRRRALWS